MKTNTKYKDRFFRFIFGSEEYKYYTLDLYNSLNNTNYENLDDLEFTTIDDVLYMGMKNDISYIVQPADEMVLYEHQSTYNPNMPLRGLLYYGRLYDAYITKNEINIYGREKISIPTPKYVVFYNGLEEHEDKEILRLSDLFERSEKSSEECYEWTATMLNINKGRNKELMERCKPLADYAEVIYIIRKEVEKNGKVDGIDLGILEAIKRGLFTDILIKNRAEVKGMLLSYYNEEEQMRIERKEGRKEEIFESVYCNDYSALRGAEKLELDIKTFEQQYNEWKKQNKK